MRVLDEIERAMPYRSATLVRASDVAVAYGLAEDYTTGVLFCNTAEVGFLERRKVSGAIGLAAAGLFELTRQEFVGDVAMADRDIASGLLEPYSPRIKEDREILITKITGDILAGNIIITER